MYFIGMRDELCRNGDTLLTPALSYSESHLLKALEVEKREKSPKEEREDLEKKHNPGVCEIDMSAVDVKEEVEEQVSLGSRSGC